MKFENLLVVYNICELSNKNSDMYIDGIDGLLNQNYNTDNYTIAVSGCGVSLETKTKLLNRYKNVAFIFILDELPMSITFNTSVCVMSQIKKFDGYIYVDSGMICKNPNILSEINKRPITKKYGMLSIQPSTDTGLIK